MENGSGKFASTLTAVAVLAATAQALIMWMGRNSHVELNLHLERVKACAGIAAKFPPMSSSVGSLADFAISAPAPEDRQMTLDARIRFRQLQQAINEHLSVLELIGDAEMRKESASFALDIEELANIAAGVTTFADQKFGDTRAGLIEKYRTFVENCRQRLGVKAEKADAS